MKITSYILGAMSFIGASTTSSAMTVILDFNDLNQANTSRYNESAEQVSTFRTSDFGITDTTANRNELYNRVLTEVKKDYSFDIGYVSGNAFYNGQQPNIDFELGNFGTGPVNGDSEYYYIQIGTSVRAGEQSFGRAVNFAIRGVGGHQVDGLADSGDVVASIFSNNIGGFHYAHHGLDQAVHMLAGTISHEIGHTIGMSHLDYGKAYTTKNGIPPLMATGQADGKGLPVWERREDREFATAGVDYDTGQSFNNVALMTIGLGTRPIPEPSTAMLSFAGIGMMLLRRKR